MHTASAQNVQAKGPYFFYFLEKFTFVTISSKIEWVSKNGVFFFPVPEKKIHGLKRVSEWGLNYFQEKKKYKEKKYRPRVKKNTTKNWVKNGFFEKIYHIPLFFIKAPPEKLSEWHVNSFWEKKSTAVFFFPVFGKKRYNYIWNRVSEWPQTFPRKKKYGTFAPT